jgi:hypothetical protein
MPEEQPGVDAAVAPIRPRSGPTTPGAAAPNKEEPDALRDFRQSLFELLSKPEDEIPERRSNYARELIRRVINPLYRRKMDYHELFAKYVGLWSVLEAPEAQRYAMQAFLGIKYLVNGRLGTSQAIYEEIEFHTSTPAALSYVMRGIAVFLRSLALISFLFGYFILSPMLATAMISVVRRRKFHFLVF